MPERIGPGEFDLIERFRRRSANSPSVRLGIGDDCAWLKADRADQLVTTDMLMDGRHFHLDEAGPSAVGRKAMGVNLSDIAAMAGRPTAAVVAVALPRDQAASIAGPLFEGLTEIAGRFGVPIVGGDTNAWNGPLVICVTVLGHAVPPGPALRSSAHPDDAVLVTGPLGGSLRGRHLSPNPRIEEAQAIRRAVDRLALIDLSDGLASDLGHILGESGMLGAVLDAGKVPVHEDAHYLAALDGRSPLDHALTDGEDFELCLTVSQQDADRLLVAPPIGVTLYRIGRVTKEAGIRLRNPDGTEIPCVRRGFDHLE